MSGDAARCALLASLLNQGRTVHLYSCALTVVSLAGLATAPPRPGVLALLGLSALLGAAQTYLAVRVGFDAAIFRLAGENRTGWEEIDDGLAGLRLAPRRAAGRPLDSRIAGAMRLLRRQGLATAFQALLMLAALAARA